MLIDDGGTPGQISDSEALDPSRKTWVATILTPDQVAEVASQIAATLELLEELTGAKEFHFHQIYGGRGPFKTIDVKKRVGLMGFMAHIFRSSMFTVIAQTFDDRFVAEFRSKAPLPDRVGRFDFQKPSDLALFWLLFRVKNHLLENMQEFALPAYCVVDAGFIKAGQFFEIPSWGHVYEGSGFFSADSVEFPALQLADYAAFAFTRSQWLLGKSNRSRVDDAFLQILADIRLNVVDVPEVSIDPRSFGPRDYEEILKDDRINKGASPWPAKVKPD